MNPYRLKDVFNYLTSNNQLLKRKLKLGTDEIPIPPKRSDVTTIEAINRFNKANPRVDTTNLKPLSVKHSKVRQSNVNEPNEGAIQSAFDTATKEAQFEGYPAPNYEKFKARYLKKNMKADGGRIGYKDGPKFDVQASGTKSGKQQIEGAPDGITSDKETINAILTMDIPLTEKVNLIGDLQYGKYRDKVEYNDDEIFLDDPKSYRNRNIGFEYNRGGEGFSGSATVGDEGPEYKIKYKKSFADGGMLVKPSDDGSRPGYSVDKRNDKFRVTNKRGDVTYSDWAKKNGYAQTFDNEKEAKAADKAFKDSVPTKTKIKQTKWTDEITKLSNDFNKKVLKDFNNGNMSNTPTWKSFLESKKLKHASVGFYQSLAPEYKVINTGVKKSELLNVLIGQANNNFKYVPWMDIQKKISISPVINTKAYRKYIDALDSQAVKASKAFDYLLNNDVELKLPKNLSKTMAAEGSLLRKVIHDLTGVNTAGIRKGLNSNDAFNKYFDQLEFARRGNLFTQGEGRTLSEILENADYRMKGNISWTSDIKLSNRANKNVFDYALRNFNYHQLNKTSGGQIQFYDKKTNKPIDWDTLPKNKNGFRVLKPNSVYFIDSTDPSSTKWDMAKIDADNMKWSKGTGSSGMFDEVFQAKDRYDKLLSTPVSDPRDPKGKKISFGKLMSEVYQTGFDNFGNPYAIEHARGVAESPFNDIKIASQRINSALSALNRNKTFDARTKKLILNELQKEVFDPKTQNVIDEIIQSTMPLQKDVLVEGKKFNQSQLNMTLELIKQRNPAVAKKIQMTLNSGLPVDQIAAEIARIPGVKQFGRAFMKIGGPFEVAFAGMDIANEVSKGAPLDTAFQTGVSNITFGALGNPEKYQMRDLSNAASEIGVNNTGFQELKDILDLEKKIEEEKQLLIDMGGFNQQIGGEGLKGNFDLDQKRQDIVALEKDYQKKAMALRSLENFDSLFQDYNSATEYLARKEYNKTLDSRKDRVYPESGTMGSDFMTTFLNPIQSFLPQNLMETGLGVISNATRPYVRAAQKIPFIGSIFEPTSDAAKLSAMSQEEKDQRALNMNVIKQNYHPVMGTTMTNEQMEPYYDKFFSKGGIASLTDTIPPKSGPTPHGLPSLMKRGIKIKE